MLLLFVYKKRF